MGQPLSSEETFKRELLPKVPGRHPASDAHSETSRNFLNHAASAARKRKKGLQLPEPVSRASPNVLCTPLLSTLLEHHLRSLTRSLAEYG